MRYPVIIVLELSPKKLTATAAWLLITTAMEIFVAFLA